MDLNVNSFVIFLKLLDLFKIYVQKHTEAIIYLTILSLKRIVILYQTSSSQTLFPIIEHTSLQCVRHHPVWKQIAVRAIRRIKDDAIVKDLDKFSIDQRCVDVDTMVEMYDRFLSELLDKHAPLKKKMVVDRPLINEWMTDNILALKAIRQKNELIVNLAENSHYNKLQYLL